MRLIQMIQFNWAKSFSKKSFRVLSLLTVMVIISLTSLSTATRAVDIDQSDIPSLVSVEGPSDASPEQDMITVSDQDLIESDTSFFHENAIIDDLKTIFNSFTVTVTVGGKAHEIETTGGTVRDAIEGVFAIGEGDLVNFELTDPLTEGMNIVVTDIEWVTEVKQVTLDFETDIQYSSDYYAGQVKNIAGEQGLKEYTYQYKYVDGQLVDTTLLKEEVVREPVNAKTYIGTKQATKTYLTSGINYISSLVPETDFLLDDSYRPINYSRVMRGTASAYSSDPYTATGKRCRTGYVAVNPSIIPYHTKMYIVCEDNSYFYGYASAEDTGGFIHWGTRIVDLYLDTEEACETFGLRTVEMYLFD